MSCRIAVVDQMFLTVVQFPLLEVELVSGSIGITTGNSMSGSNGDISLKYCWLMYLLSPNLRSELSGSVSVYSGVQIISL